MKVGNGHKAGNMSAWHNVVTTTGAEWQGKAELMDTAEGKKESNCRLRNQSQAASGAPRIHSTSASAESVSNFAGTLT